MRESGEEMNLNDPETALIVAEVGSDPMPDYPDWVYRDMPSGRRLSEKSWYEMCREMVESGPGLNFSVLAASVLRKDSSAMYRGQFFLSPTALEVFERYMNAD